MSGLLGGLMAGRGRSVFLAVFLMVQTLAVVFFVGDVLLDVMQNDLGPHLYFEVLVSLALAMSVGLGAVALRQTLEELAAQDQALASARGALGDVIAAQFTAWGLTPAERDVAFLALKGLDVAEIAELRGRASGTVRAQLTRIYAKAGVSGRAQFAAWFVEDLLGEGLEPPREG